MSSEVEKDGVPRKSVIRWAIWAVAFGLFAGAWVTYKYLTVS